MDSSAASALPLATVITPTTFGARLAALPMKPLVTLLLGAAALAAVAIVLVLQGQRPDWRVLYANLGDKDNGAILAQLTLMNVPYRLTDGSGTIMIGADRVHEVRMKLSAAKLPKGSIDGYELLDNQKFGQTQAGENVSIKRALEGELMRTIGGLDAVASAKVHLALPAQNGFFREQQKPSASVTLHLHPGRTLDRAQLAGIVHLVSRSVPELSPKAVSVTDGSGSLLTEADSHGSAGLDAQQLQYLHQVEAGLQRRVLELIEPVVGRENLRASITAELDFSESMLVSEEYKPNQGEAPASVKSQQTMEATQPGPATPSGVPGAQSNQPPVPATAPVTGSAQALQGAQGGAANNNARRESTTNFEVDKTQRTVRNATGTVKRLSAAVVVNHRIAADAKGKTTSTPLSAEELEKINSLVQQGIGFNKERGDTVRVINAPFRVDSKPTPEAAPVWQQPWLSDLLRSAAAPLALALVALLIFGTMVRPALKEMLKPVVAAAPIDTVVDDPLMLPNEQPLALEAPKSTQKLDGARSFAKANPAATANIVRGMINGDQAA